MPLSGRPQAVRDSPVQPTETGFYAGRYVATQDGFAVEKAAATDEGIVDGVAVAIPEEEAEQEEEPDK